MNIVFLAHFAGAPQYGMVFGHYCLAREWVRMGHNVTIVAASFSHTRFKQPHVFKNKITEEYIDGIRYLWVPCPIYDANSKFERVLNILSYTFKTWMRRFVDGSVDIVIASSHYPLIIFAARKLAKKSHAKLIFEVRDLWPLTLIELGGVKVNHPFIKILQWAENYAYRHADYVVSVLSNAKSYMIQHGMRDEKFLYIPNGADLENREKEKLLPDPYIEQIEKIRMMDGFLIGFAGRLVDANCLNGLIDALYLLDSKKIFVFLLGGGYSRKNLEKKCTDMGLEENIIFLEAVSKYQVADFLCRMDALYLGFQKKTIYRFGVSPTKLNDYLLAAKPVICAIDADIEAINQSGAGIMCRSCESAEIVAAIKTLRFMSPEMRKKMGEKGRAWAQHHLDYRMLAKRFLDGIGCSGSNQKKIA